jgi:hypothetical protein
MSGPRTVPIARVVKCFLCRGDHDGPGCPNVALIFGGDWSVWRWSGRVGDKPLVRRHHERKGVAYLAYRRIARALRQGSVRLVDPEGVTVLRTVAPRLRTRW